MQGINEPGKTRKCPKCKQEDIPITSKECIHCGADVRNWFVRHKIATFFLVILFIAIIANPDSKNASNTSSPTKTIKTEQVVSKKPETANPEEMKEVTKQIDTEPTTPEIPPKPESKTPSVVEQPKDIIASIQNILSPTGKYEVTIWTLDGDFAKPDSKPPFDIIINTSAGQIQDCFAAKNIMFELIKTAYTNDQIKDKIARVQFTAWGQLKASLGSKDTGFDWNESGSSNFWKVLQQYNPNVDETSPIDQRTFGQRINKNCQ